MKNKTTLWWIIGIIVVIVGLFGWSKVAQNSDPNVIATRGLHWHPHIAIYVNGEEQEIPANIGIGMQHASSPTFNQSMRMTAMHTHETDGIIHLEFPGRVTKDDTKLGNFFAIWGKDVMSFGESVTMTVNGQENTEFGEYEMKDGDEIILRYE